MLEQTSQSQNVPSTNFLQSCKVIFSITFGQTIRSKKTVIMLIVTFLPVLLAVCYRILGRDVLPQQALSRIVMINPEQVLSHTMLFSLQFLSALVALFYGTALLADEVDNRTIVCLVTRPIRKYSIILGKFAAYMVETLLVLIPPMVITFLIIATDNRMSSDFALSLSLFGKRLGVTILALVTYGAIFTFFGASLKRPVISGLLLAFGWEKIVVVIPFIIRKLSVAHYLLSAFPKGQALGYLRHPGRAIADSSVLLSIIILLVIAGIFLGLSIFTIYRKEYRFE